MRRPSMNDAEAEHHGVPLISYAGKRVECSCGWKGEPVVYIAEAWLDHDRHVEEARVNVDD